MSPMRLEAAAKAVFGEDCPSANWLKKQVATGRLAAWLVAGKYYTTPQAVEEMLCALKAPVSGSNPPMERSAPSGLSATPESGQLALAALRVSAAKLKGSLPTTSQESTAPKDSGAVIPYPSR